MASKKLKDSEAKRILLKWPMRTKRLWPVPGSEGFWIRGQPKDTKAPGPTISSPGAVLFKTQPDGLWAYFGNTESCDVVAIEVCGSIQNLNDKRSRYMPASNSLVLNARLAWLTETISLQKGGKSPRWKAVGSLKSKPKSDLVVPIRHLRVLYALPNKVYDDWCSNHTPTGFEYFCRHSSLDSYNSQKMQQFLRQMSISSQYYISPKGQ